MGHHDKSSRKEKNKKRQRSERESLENESIKSEQDIIKKIIHDNDDGDGDENKVSMTKRKHSVLFDTKSEYTSYLASFPNSDRPSSEKIEFGLFHRPDRKNRMVLSGKSAEVLYEGRNYGESNNNRKLCRYLIFAYDKKTHKATLMNKNEDGQYPFEIRNVIKNLPQPNTEVLKDPIDESQVETLEEYEKIRSERRRELNKNLVETFGSSRRKKARDDWQLNVIDNVASGGKVLSMLAATATKSSSNDLEVEEDGEMQSRRALLPAFDINAEDPEDVYLAEGLMPDEIRSALSETARATRKLIKKKSFDSTGYCQFVVAAISDLKDSGDSKSTKVARLRHLLFYQYLYQFRSLPKYKIEKCESSADLAQLIDAPTPVCDHILTEFTAPHPTMKRCMTTLTGDKLILRMMAIALTVEGYVVKSRKITCIANDFKKSSVWIINYFLQLGCKQMADRELDSEMKGIEGKRVVLTTPLKFPAPRKSRK